VNAPLVRGKLTLRLVSLLLALLIWITYSGRIYEKRALEERYVQVPLVYQSQPPNTRIDINNYVIQVTLEGSDEELAELRNDEVSVRISLEAASEGLHTFSITSENVTWPSRYKTLEVKNIAPDTVEFTLTETMEKDVPVIVMYQGEPAEGYEVIDVKVSPARVTIQGPRDDVSKLNQLVFNPLDVTGHKEDMRGPVQIDYARQVGRDVAIKGNPVISYRVIIREKEKYLEMDRVYELDRSELPESVAVQTTEIELEISGPISVVDWFQPEWIRPSLNGRDLTRLREERALEPAPNEDGETPPEREDQPLMLPIKEQWQVPAEVTEADPDWFIKVSQLKLTWIPDRVEVREQ